MKASSRHRSPLLQHPLRLATACALVLAPLAARAADGDATRHVGDPAPALTLEKFVKGAPVKAFEKGKVYVVEFWATQSGPSVDSIPQLTKLQKDYPNITFIGVDSGEDEKTVEPFVKKMGDKMNYRVAVDDLASVADGATHKAFLDAAKQEGIPTAFVVDKNSRLAWIGNPANLPPVLKQIAANTPAAEKVAAEDADPDLASVTEVNRDPAGATEVDSDLALAMVFNPELEQAMDADPLFARVIEVIFANSPELADLIMTGEIGPDDIKITPETYQGGAVHVVTVEGK